MKYAKFKGLMYPTIRMNADADNLAITQMAMDKGFLQFEKVEFIEIIEVNNNVYTYKILDVAFKITEGEIKWKNLSSFWITDSINHLYLIDDNNEVFAYNCQGDIIESSKNNA